VNLVAGSNITLTQSGNNLTISSSGGGGGGGVNADWDETDPLEPSYIENKPTPKTLTAGANISISEGQNTLTISAAAGLPASTSADEGKCLVVDSNGDPEWGTGGKVYTGTDGVIVDNVNDTVGLEAPVDIVAGPGIAIDNPDGNTLRVSTDSAYETVLWSGSPTNSVTLSETMNNFEFIDVYERWDNANANAIVHRIYMEGKTTAVLNFSIGGNAWYLVVQKLDLNGTSLSVNSAHAIHGSSYTSTDIVHESNTTLLKNTIAKVVGIHRIANN
jgi:hypothetical protein